MASETQRSATVEFHGREMSMVRMSGNGARGELWERERPMSAGEDPNQHCEEAGGDEAC